ncbi:MAG: porin family protein [Janthinobacterium lividum]
MKISSLLTLGLLAAPMLGQAQTGQPIRFGLKAGATLATIVGPGTSGAPAVSPLLGGVGGVFATVPLGSAQRWFLQPELLYSQQGYRLRNSPTDYEATIRSGYLKLPLLLGVTHGGFFAAVGPQVGYLVNDRRTFRFHEYSPTTGPSPDVSENVNTDLRGYQRWEFSAVAAVGYRWACGAGLELRYSDTFASQSRNGQFSTYGYPDAHSLSGQVQASYLLPWH